VQVGEKLGVNGQERLLGVDPLGDDERLSHTGRRASRRCPRGGSVVRADRGVQRLCRPPGDDELPPDPLDVTEVRVHLLS
jgi:hypothetical protein